MRSTDLFGAAFRPVLQVNVPQFLEETVAEMVAFLPRLVGALIILLVGWIVGVAVAKVVQSLADNVGMDRAVLGTPLGKVLGGTERAVSKAFGTLAKWFVYALAILAAANVLAIPTLSEWIATAVSYLPAFIAGLVIIVLGFVVADFIGDAIMRTRAATETEYTSWFAAGTRMFLYFTAIVIGLDTIGVDVDILYVFANALAWGIAAAIAIGVGVALGWGGHGYVEQHIDNWMGKASRGAPKPRTSSSEAHQTTLTQADEGKEVRSSDGERIGILSRVRRGIGFVDPDPQAFGSVQSRLNWGDDENEAQPIRSEDIEEVTDDEIRLRMTASR